mmetsp:Transcript_35940/g.70401  ORF Transcript_35940/g.70401 Transcript_35940/m.70401 type:complete len:316 (+) Transcript_35940:115-1062(+)
MSEDREFSRANRGNRMQLLIGEALEAAQSGANAVMRGSDGQIGEMDGEAITYNDYFNESSDAGSYVQSEEEEDYVDSDFMTDDDAEDEDDDENEADVKDQEKQERKKANKKGAYVDPAKRANRTMRMEEDDSDGSEGGKRPPKVSRKSMGGDAGSAASRADRAFRSSTKQRSEMSKEAATEAAKQRQETAKSRPVAEERRYTQEELLEEAKLTAVENEKDLRRLVRIEEDMKKVVWHKVQLTGPRVIFRSTKEGNTVTWTEPATMPEGFGGGAPQAHKREVCCVTGQAARYLDPVTKQPFATVAAFKKLREQAGA